MKPMRGEELRRIRRRLGLTQVAFAEQMGWHPNSVARAERGEMRISATAARLARLLLTFHEGRTSKSRQRR